MEPEYVAFMIVGAIITLVIQWYGRRKAAQAVAAPDREARRSIEILTGENDRQVGQIDQLQERIAVLERIATDTGYRTAREIDLLGQH